MGRPRKNPEFIMNICKTCGETFSIKYAKRTQKFCSKSCAQHNPETKSKMIENQKKTFQKNYGVDHPMKSDKIVQNFKRSMKEKYGVEHALCSSTFVEKSKKTKSERYGDENFNNTEKTSATCLKRYGVTNIRQSEDFKESFAETRRSTHFDKLIEYCKSINVSPLFSKDDYKGYHFSQFYDFKCHNCDTTFKSTIYKMNNVECEVCNPYKSSKMENEIFSFLREITETDTLIERRNRQILSGQEIDLFLEKYKLGIELNGLYWHSEEHGKTPKGYHLNKTKQMISSGYKLIHIFDDEWVKKKEIVKSILSNSIGISNNRIAGRKCSIESLKSNICKDFLIKNHIQGADRSSIKLGLFYDGELVSVMTFCKSRFDKNIQYEMSRYCNKLNTSIIGGASKLFKRFLSEYNPTSVVSYADRRFFDGNVYGVLGFNFVSNTPESYYYITADYKTKLNRLQFQKHKLKEKLPSFDESLSEWKNMKLNGFDRIWDCGNSKWVWSYGPTIASPLNT